MMIKILVLLFVLISMCEGVCIEKERQALLTIKGGLVDTNNLLSSWTTNNNLDCCNWRGIRCDNLTNHIIALDLNFDCLDNDDFMEPCFMGSEIDHYSLVELQHLRYLDLSNNNFNKIPKFLGSLTKLKYLNLANNPIIDTIKSPQQQNLTKLEFLDLDIDQSGKLILINLEWLSYLPSLKILRLSNTNLNDKATNWLHSIKSSTPSLLSLHFDNCVFPQVDVLSLSHANSSNSLKDFHISFSTILNHSIIFPWLLNLSTNMVNLTIRESQLQGGLPNSFENMRFLERIDLSSNEFEGGIPKSFSDLCNLKELNMGFNKLNTTLPQILESLNGCAKNSLEMLDVGYNKIRRTFPNNFSMLPNLKWLDVSYNKLNGTLSENIIGELHHLEKLYMSSNSFIGFVSDVHFQNNSKLKDLELSGNSLLTLNFTPTWIPPFQLESLLLRSCKLGPHFPTWLKTQVYISEIDISNSGIQDEIPNWFCNQTLFPLAFANLSSNQFHGIIPPSLSNVISLYFSNNDKLISLTSFLCNQTHHQGITSVLEFSNNMVFEKSLPNCEWSLKKLVVLNLNNNQFSGVVPRSIGLLHDLSFLILRQNNFSGYLPSLQNCTQLQVLDVVENNLEGYIPSWIGERLQNLQFLRLKSNKFYGVIPLSLCHLQLVQILDLSSNNLIGAIPSCIDNITSMVKAQDTFGLIFASISSTKKQYMFYNFNALIMWKGADHEYIDILGLLRMIDLSYNKLSGKIPHELTNLMEAVVLNLSRNNLSGEIPSDIGKLSNLDSLDLSHNKFSGVIPTSLAQLSFLSYMDLSSNQLSGKIPTSTQLQSFNASSYMNNIGLCGPPLTNSSCLGDNDDDGDQESIDDRSDHDVEWLDMPWLRMGVWIGFLVGFVGVCATLWLTSMRVLSFHSLIKSFEN
ncbi:receptor-like protein EIX2 [Cannabis sativa]|uniref:receptor-like protein EIX2 n=1 Tax=Cannabis sativa TaxID=3483 RepID=UPI0011E0268A|nr:receptor-like protein EIX2 [Cannabis sativa]